MSSSAHQTDIAIIGAGPVGLFAVFECGMLKMRSAVIDALDMAGGQCAALYPEKPIYDIPGYPRIEAMALIDKLTEQIAPFHPAYHLGQQVEAVEPAGEGWRLTTSAGTRIEARCIFIAAGVGAFGPNRPPLAGIEAYEGKSVFYLVKRREDFRDKRVVIAGGGDSAVDWANSLAELAAKIYVVHRRPKFRAAPESVAMMERLVAAGRVELVVPYQLHGLEGSGGKLAAVIVQTLEGETRRLEADALLPFFGLAMNLGPIARWGLALDRNHIKVDPATYETSARGIHAIGDIASYPGKLKLILTGFAEAAAAAHAAYARVHPGEALHFEYSTTKGVPSA
jgi:thioredoxin reductase (NADPH)